MAENREFCRKLAAVAFQGGTRAMTSRGGEVDRHIHAAGSSRVSAGQGWNSDHPGRQSVYQASPSRGGEVDRKTRAAGSFRVSAGQGGNSDHPGQGSVADTTPAVFRTRSGRGGEVDRRAGAAGSFRVMMAIRGVFPRKRFYHPGRQSVFHQVSPSRGSEVDRLAGAAGSFWAYASPWQ